MRLCVYVVVCLGGVCGCVAPRHMTHVWGGVSLSHMTRYFVCVAPCHMIS